VIGQVVLVAALAGHIGVEAAYVGSARGHIGAGLGGDQLMSNGADTDVRIAAPMRATDDVDDA
jgi:hypothetical protein